MKKKIDTLFRKLILILQKPQMRVLPGNLAFFLVLSIVPLVTLLVFLGSLLNIPVDQLLSSVNQVLPNEITEFLMPAFTESSINLGTIIILFITFFVASNGSNCIIITSNTLYKINDTNPIKNRLKAIIITIVILLLILFMFTIPLFGKQIIYIISNLLNSQNFYNNFMIIYNILKIPISLLFIYICIKFIYTISPDKVIQSKDVTSGAIFTTISWVITTEIYSIYLANFSNYGRVYGNLSNIIILMLFVYLLAFIFVIGMALNASKNELDETLEKTGKIKITEFVHNSKGYTK